MNHDVFKKYKTWDSAICNFPVGSIRYVAYYCTWTYVRSFMHKLIQWTMTWYVDIMLIYTWDVDSIKKSADTHVHTWVSYVTDYCEPVWFLAVCG